MLNEFNIGNDSSLMDLDNITKAQILHAKETIQRYENLKDIIRRHETSFKEYVNHLVKIVEEFETITTGGPDWNIYEAINPVNNKVNDIIEQFNKRIEPILTEFLKHVKNLQKIIKERGYLELDLKKYNSENKKLKEKQQLQDKEYKKVFENQRKIEESKEKYDQLNGVLKRDLPIFLTLSNKIGENISIIIIYYVHDLYKTLNEFFQLTRNFFPVKKGEKENGKVYIETFTYTVKEIQKEICEEIEALQLFNKYLSVFNVPAEMAQPSQPPSYKETVMNIKVGKALYDFQGQEPGDLSFRAGDRVVVVEESPGGWWRGRLEKKEKPGGVVEGSFPYNYFAFEGGAESP